MPRPRRITPLDAGPAPIDTQAAPLSLVPTAAEPEVAEAAPSRTPARQKLADAIETVRALETEIAEASTAVSQSERDLSIARVALDEAEDALERAKPRPANGFARTREPHSFRSQDDYDAYTAVLNTPPPPIEDARAAVAKATDARDSALAAVQFHKKRLDELTNRLQWRRPNIDDAARLAVHFDPAMAALAAETKRLVTQGRCGGPGLRHGDGRAATAG